MTELNVLTPEIEGLLREIAADPDSCLLRLPRAEVFSAAVGGFLPEPSGITGITNSERELLRLYSKETAFLLRVACGRLIVDPQIDGFMVAKAMRGREFQLDPDRAWRRAAEIVLGPTTEEQLSSTIALLTRCVASQPGEFPRVLSLAAASMRLEPTASARTFAGLDLILMGFPTSGRRVLGPAVSSKSHGVFAQANICFAFEREGRIDRAYDVLEHIEDVDFWSLHRATFGLAIAAQLGRKHDAEMWARKLKEDESSDQLFLQLARDMLQRRRRGIWTPLPGSFEILHRVGEQFGLRAQLIAKVFRPANPK